MCISTFLFFYSHMQYGKKGIFFLVVAALLAVVPAGAVLASTTVGNNVSVGGTLGVTGATTLSGTLAVTGVTTVTANILPATNNAVNLGSFGAALQDVFVSSSLTIGGNGSTVSSTAIRAHISVITSAINLAETASTTACSSSSVAVSGAALGDTVVAAPTGWDDAFNGGIVNATVQTANTVILKYCAFGSAFDDHDPASMTYRIDVWKH
jgi:hypothetical protein